MSKRPAESVTQSKRIRYDSNFSLGNTSGVDNTKLLYTYHGFDEKNTLITLEGTLREALVQAFAKKFETLMNDFIYDIEYLFPGFFYYLKLFYDEMFKNGDITKVNDEYYINGNKIYGVNGIYQLAEILSQYDIFLNQQLNRDVFKYTTQYENAFMTADIKKRWYKIFHNDDGDDDVNFDEIYREFIGTKIHIKNGIKSLSVNTQNSYIKLINEIVKNKSNEWILYQLYVINYPTEEDIGKDAESVLETLINIQARPQFNLIQGVQVVGITGTHLIEPPKSENKYTELYLN